MSKWGAFFKRVVKAILWLSLGFVLLFILVVLLIRIPSVQNKIVDFATSFISSKTQTRVEIENVGISFPKAIVLEGIFLEDTHADTLIYARKMRVNIALYGLFSNKIDISSVALEDATIKLYSAVTDPLFNYNFLITAFSDTTKQVSEKTSEPSLWKFSLDKINLTNVKFTYYDDYGGMRVFAAITQAETRVGEISPKKSLYAFNKLIMSGLNVRVQTSEPAYTQAKNPDNILPTVTAKNLQINNSSVTYADSVNFLSVISVIDQLELSDASIDIHKEQLIFDQLSLSKSDIRYHNFEPVTIADSLSDSISSSGNNWKVIINRMNMDDNIFIYRVGEVTEAKNEFNPAHLEFEHMTFTADDFYYDRDLVKISVKDFSATDQNGFIINNLETDFSMDATSINADKIKLKTPDSSIDADFYVQYSTLESFTQEYKFNNLKLVMRSVSFKNNDALYFSNDLIDLPFFTNLTNITTAKGTISGPLNNLSGRNLVIKTGENTILETDFNIAGLPNVQKASYNFPNLKVISGKNDLIMMAGPSIPENIELPEDISLDAVFKGKIKEFESVISLNSSFGDINLNAWVDKEENFSGNINVTGFDLGKLLKDSLLYGPVSLTAEAAGQGLDKNTVMADIKGEVTELFLNRYTYKNLTLDGTLFGQEFSGKINLDDEYAEFNFEGLVGLNPGLEFYQFKFNLEGADLQKLNKIGRAHV